MSGSGSGLKKPSGSGFSQAFRVRVFGYRVGFSGFETNFGFRVGFRVQQIFGFGFGYSIMSDF